MATQETPGNTNDAPRSEETSAPTATAIPDFLLSPNAIFKDEGVAWRYGKAPDYSKTRKVWEEGRSMHHAPGSMEEFVENLVKNWEVEASFKPRLADWRTINHEKYSFAMAGGPPQSAEHMIKVGTYNGIIAPNEYYSPANSDFASSHKTFKRMMPTFAWEVLEIYSPPPRVAFRWRHWGTMKNDYVGFNDKGEKVTAKAHGGQIDIQGVTVASVDEKFRLCDLQTWMDPLEMFRQIAPQGVVNKEVMNRKVDMETALDMGPDGNGKASSVAGHGKEKGHHSPDAAPEATIIQAKHESNATGLAADAYIPHQGTSADRSHEGHSDEMDVQFHDAQESQHPAAAIMSCPRTGARAIIATAATHGAQAPVVQPASTYQEVKARLPADQPTSSEHQPEQTRSDDDDDDDYDDDHKLPRSIYTSAVNGREEPSAAPQAEDVAVARDLVDSHVEQAAEQVHPQQPKDAEQLVQPAPGEAVVAAASSEETRATHEEMSRVTPGECPVLMNRE
ncbi:Hypothetical predicted protein [Lecanosticta acicola]|uniref:Pathogen-related protein n=1 Tax=Lecanosticta acicola TaxID=111012 RepID=A0AAI8YUJ9_9PEZI|nr:Hypothetical predicted protein [Lecanosticta acicola]